MSSGIKGDTKALQERKRRVGQIASPEFRMRVLNVIGQEALHRVLQGFEKSKDPYGVPWKSLQLRNGKPLMDTGRLRNSINLRVVDAGHFEIATDVKYAKLHQHGGTITPKHAKALSFRAGKKRIFAKSVTVPARPFLPDGRGMPRGWSAAFKREAYEFIQRHAGKNARRKVLGGK